MEIEKIYEDFKYFNISREPLIGNNESCFISRRGEDKSGGRPAVVNLTFTEICHFNAKIDSFLTAT